MARGLAISHLHLTPPRRLAEAVSAHSVPSSPGGWLAGARTSYPRYPSRQFPRKPIQKDSLLPKFSHLCFSCQGIPSCTCPPDKLFLSLPVPELTPPYLRRPFLIPPLPLPSHSPAAQTHGQSLWAPFCALPQLRDPQTWRFVVAVLWLTEWDKGLGSLRPRLKSFLHHFLCVHLIILSLTFLTCSTTGML